MSVQVQQSHSGVVPSRAGVGGFVHQTGTASISDGERVRIVVEEVTASVVRSWYIERSGERYDISTDVPAGMRSEYTAVVAYWRTVVQGWAPVPVLAA